MSGGNQRTMLNYRQPLYEGKRCKIELLRDKTSQVVLAQGRQVRNTSIGKVHIASALTSSTSWLRLSQQPKSALPCLSAGAVPTSCGTQLGSLGYGFA